MKITNRNNLPKALVNAILKFNDEYERGESDYTTTQLVNPAQQLFLIKQFSGELTEDVSDMIYKLMGSSMHKILEMAAGPDAIVEQRFYADIDGFKIGGQIDCYEDNILYDYKWASIWESVYGVKEDKIQQMNINAYLLRKAGKQVDKGIIVYLFRDWSKSKARYDKAHPDEQEWEYEVSLWSDEQVEFFIRERLAVIDDPEPCTLEEQWADATKYAVKTAGRKSAHRLLDTEQEAYTYITTKNITGAYIEKRPSAKRRCDDYCMVRDVCPQYGREQEAVA